MIKKYKHTIYIILISFIAVISSCNNNDTQIEYLVKDMIQCFENIEINKFKTIAPLYKDITDDEFSDLSLIFTPFFNYEYQTEIIQLTNSVFQVKVISSGSSKVIVSFNVKTEETSAVLISDIELSKSYDVINLND